MNQDLATKLNQLPADIDYSQPGFKEANIIFSSVLAGCMLMFFAIRPLSVFFDMGQALMIALFTLLFSIPCYIIGRVLTTNGERWGKLAFLVGLAMLAASLNFTLAGALHGMNATMGVLNGLRVLGIFSSAIAIEFAIITWSRHEAGLTFTMAFLYVIPVAVGIFVWGTQPGFACILVFWGLAFMMIHLAMGTYLRSGTGFYTYLLFWYLMIAILALIIVLLFASESDSCDCDCGDSCDCSCDSTSSRRSRMQQQSLAAQQPMFDPVTGAPIDPSRIPNAHQIYNPGGTPFDPPMGT